MKLLNLEIEKLDAAYELNPDAKYVFVINKQVSPEQTEALRELLTHAGIRGILVLGLDATIYEIKDDVPHQS
jgi:hypothetical protein